MSTPEEIIDQISEELKSGRKIQAIKILRQATGFGLKEAKEYIDSGKPITVDMIKNVNITNTSSGCGSKAAAALAFISTGLYYLVQ